MTLFLFLLVLRSLFCEILDWIIPKSLVYLAFNDMFPIISMFRAHSKLPMKQEWNILERFFTLNLKKKNLLQDT